MLPIMALILFCIWVCHFSSPRPSLLKFMVDVEPTTFKVFSSIVQHLLIGICDNWLPFLVDLL